MTSIHQKTALITGSGKRRLGWHIAHALAERGYALALHYRSSAAEAESTVMEFQKRGLQAIALQADLTVEEEVRALIQKAHEHLGSLDVLVQCAGAWSSKVLEEVHAADVRHDFEVNVLSTFLCAQQAGLIMAAQPQGGCIINFGDWAMSRPYPNYAAYFASKGAIPTLTRCLAVELAARNPKVRVNCILPGPVLLPEDLPEPERQEAIAGTLVRRAGTPANIVQAVLYLLDNDFVTGTCMTVDGGRSIHPGQLP